VLSGQALAGTKRLTGLSIMPEGLEEKLPKRDMADLIGYLMSIR